MTKVQIHLALERALDDEMMARISDANSIYGIEHIKILPSLKRPHMDYLHEFYADTALFGGGIHAVRCGL